MNSNLDNLKEVLSTTDKFSAPKRLNFHCHTIYSDGSLEPAELFKQACNHKLEHIAITDHHSIKSCLIINDLISRNNHVDGLPTFWNGIEISCTLKGCLVHILGLGIDVYSPLLAPYITGEAPMGYFLDSVNVIDIIRKSGGMSILAHPARYRLDYKTLIKAAKENGIDGVEVWYDYDMSSTWRPSDFICESISLLVESLGLYSSTGTDTHGLNLLAR